MMTAFYLNGVEIHSLSELREHFDTASITAAFLDGTLEQWLGDCFYEQEAKAVRRMEKEIVPATETHLRQILGVSSQAGLTPEQQAVCQRKRGVLLQYTSDEDVLSHAMESAANQAELAELLHQGCKTIYLCGGSFTVPIRESGIHYVGVGQPRMEAPFTEEQYRRAGITFQNVTLPQTSDEAAADIAEAAAANNGYDNFAEKHGRLATMIHDAVKCSRLTDCCHLDINASDAAGEFYKSKSAAERVARNAVNKVYDQANSFFLPGQSQCLAAGLANRYAEHLRKRAQSMVDRLKAGCTGREPLETWQRKLERMLSDAEQVLRERFEAELRESADYYGMYERSYFLEQVEIEKNDYNMDLFESDLMNGLARLLHDDSDYSINHLFETVSEIEEDVRQRADTFFGAAHRIYREFCEEMENIAEEIGKDLSDDELTKLGLSQT